MIDATISPWPTSGDDVCQLLHISSSPKLRCHGLTRKTENCTREISAANSKKIKILLETVAKSGNWDTAYDQLEKLSGLVLCQKNHQEQCLDLLSGWEKSLRAEEKRENSQATVKKEEEEEKVELDAPEIKREPRDRKLEEEDPKILPPPCPEAVKEEPSSDSTPNTGDATFQHRHFVQYGKNLSTREINTKMKTRILKPLSATEMKNKKTLGGVYMYTFPENYHDVLPPLKVGNSEDVNRRMKEWQTQCGYEPKLLCYFSSNLYRRVESLVHAQLENCRQIEKGCPTCGKSHNEWFFTKSGIASVFAEMWAGWTRREPYDESGKLREKWVQKLKTLDLDDAECWVKFAYEDDESE